MIRKDCWVYTGTEDDTRALPLYQKYRFRVYAQETATLDPNVQPPFFTDSRSEGVEMAAAARRG